MSEIFRRIREQLLLESPSDVAAATGVSYQLITRVRAGSRTSIRLATAEKLIAYFEKKGITI